VSTPRILKYEVPVDNQWHPLPPGTVVKVGCLWGEEEIVYVWIREPEHPRVGHGPVVRAFATGERLPEFPTEHFGSAITTSGQHIWHLVKDVSR
jgi:hypothetical protein